MPQPIDNHCVCSSAARFHSYSRVQFTTNIPEGIQLRTAKVEVEKTLLACQQTKLRDAHASIIYYLSWSGRIGGRRALPNWLIALLPFQWKRWLLPTWLSRTKQAPAWNTPPPAVRAAELCVQCCCWYPVHITGLLFLVPSCECSKLSTLFFKKKISGSYQCFRHHNKPVLGNLIARAVSFSKLCVRSPGCPRLEMGLYSDSEWGLKAAETCAVKQKPVWLSNRHVTDYCVHTWFRGSLNDVDSSVLVCEVLVVCTGFFISSPLSVH
jgi:hypothetical protein